MLNLGFKGFRMKKMLIKTIAFASLIMSGMVHADTKTGSFETTAEIADSCLLNVDGINFGVLSGPIYVRAASSSLSIKCTNKTQYTIDLAYGGIYGEGAKVDENVYGLVAIKEATGYGTYRITTNGGSVSTSADFECRSDGKVFFYNKTVAKLYGTERTGNWLQDSYSACNGNRANASKVETLGNNPAFKYGLMNGGVSGDALAYDISLPNDPTKVWNKGVNSYVALGTGGVQVIPLNASVRNVGTGTESVKYVAQDNFLDTITVTVAY